jgi:hypothetical protein
MMFLMLSNKTQLDSGQSSLARLPHKVPTRLTPITSSEVYPLAWSSSVNVNRERVTGRFSGQRSDRTVLSGNE